MISLRVRKDVGDVDSDDDIVVLIDMVIIMEVAVSVVMVTVPLVRLQ